jgi:hypothetical protein
MGSAMVLQGGLVKHLAMRAHGTSDRITLVTSYRAKAVGLYDSSFLTNVRPYTDLSVLYPQWIDYRLEVMAANAAAMNDRLVNGNVTKEELTTFLTSQRDYTRRTQRQIVPESLVHSLVARYGIPVFYEVIGMFVSGSIFDLAPNTCPQCGHVGKVDKAHVAECPMACEWMPELPVWDDLDETRHCLQRGEFSGAGRPDMEEVVEVFMQEKRIWGMADELAVQGLSEYLIEFLAFFGVPFGKK